MTRKRIVLDTNLALLLTIGATGRSNIERHKRLQAYEPEDYDLILALLDASAGVVLCPNVVSETSNLIRYVSEPTKTLATTFFASLVEQTREDYVASSDAVRHPAYAKLGVTDAVLLMLAARRAVLLTDDLDLYLAALRADIQVVNFTHEREARLG